LYVNQWRNTENNTKYRLCYYCCYFWTRKRPDFRSKKNKI